LGGLGRKPNGVVVGGHELAVVGDKMRALTRSGWVAAKMMAAGPASTSASSAARSAPTSSRTAASSSAKAPQGGKGGGGGGSEMPVPLRSKMISRQNDASVRQNRVIPGSSQPMSRCPKL